MKKLIAISVVFALVLGAAFAQPSLGGNFKVGTKILSGESVNEVDETVLNASGIFNDNLALNVGFGDANAGGKIVFYPSKDAPGYQPVFAFAWWRPIQFFRLQIGVNKDGDWGHAQIAGWGFDAEAKAVGVAVSQYGDQPPLSRIAANATTGTTGPRAWAPGVDTMSLNLSFYPIDGLQLNIGIPGSEGRFEAVYGNMYLDAMYVLGEIGTIRLASQLRPGNHNRYVPNTKEISGEVAPERHWRGNAELHDMSTIWAAFHLTAIEGLGAELGIGYTFGYTTQDVKFANDEFGTPINVGGIGFGGLPINTKVNNPISIGLGANYSAGDLGVKARLGFSLGGSKAVDAGRAKALTSEKESLNAAYKPSGHIPAEAALYLAPAAFYEVYSDINGDKFVVNRTAGGFQEKQADPFIWGLNVAPSYKLGSLTVILNLGIGMKHYAKQEVRVLKLDQYGDPVAPVNGKPVYETVTFEGKPGLYLTEKNIDVPQTMADLNSLYGKLEAVKVDVDWYVNPYITVPAGSGRFYAGFKLYTDGTRIPVKFNYNKKNADANVAGGNVPGTLLDLPGSISSTTYQVKWSIPIGFNWYF